MNQRVRVVVAMDPLKRCFLLEKLDSSKVEIYTASTLAAACKLLRETQRLNIVISETSLADGNWLAIHRELERAHPAAQMIVCVPEMGREAGEALRLGADDIIVLSQSSDECRRIIESAAGRTYIRSLVPMTAAASA